MKVVKKLVLLLFLAYGITACGASRPYLNVEDAALLGGTQPGDFGATLQTAEGHWANRLDRSELEKAIDAWEAAIPLETPGASVEDRRAAVFNVYVSLSRAYYFLADAHIRFDKEALGDEAWEKAMEQAYDKGIENAERAIYVQNPEYKKKVVDQEMDREEVAGDLGKGAVPAMYWYATNLGKWALLKGLGEALGQVDAIKAMMDRAMAVAPEYYYYGPYRYFGGYYTKLPFPGGDLEKSRENFDQAIELAPEYLASRVLLAELWAVKEDNEELFREQLQIVIDTDLSTLPADILPENTIEQKKAKLLMKQIPDLF